MSAPEPRRILVIQLRRIGDVLLTTPAVRALRRRFPTALIDFLAEPPCDAVLAGNRNLDHVIAYPPGSPFSILWRVRRAGYDWIIDFLGNPRSAILTALSGAPLRAGPGRVFHRWAYNRRLADPAAAHYVGREKMLLLEQLGVPPLEDLMPELRVPEDSRRFAEEFYRSENISAADVVVSISPTSRRRFNRWSPRRYAELGDWLQSRFSAKVILVWGPGEESAAEGTARMMRQAPIISRRTRSIMDLAAILSRATLHIGNDNGAKHVATAAGAPTFTIYGPNSPASWTYPDPKRHRFIQRECLCREDSRRKHRCLEPKCLDLATVDAVQQEVEPFLLQILADKSADSKTRRLC